MVHRVKAFADALWLFVRDGCKRAPKHVIQERFEICKTCEKFTGKACSACGCCVAGDLKLINKLAFPREECPEGKWLSHDMTEK